MLSPAARWEDKSAQVKISGRIPGEQWAVNVQQNSYFKSRQYKKAKSLLSQHTWGEGTGEQSAPFHHSTYRHGDIGCPIDRGPAWYKRGDGDLIHLSVFLFPPWSWDPPSFATSHHPSNNHHSIHHLIPPPYTEASLGIPCPDSIMEFPSHHNSSVRNPKEKLDKREKNNQNLSRVCIPIKHIFIFNRKLKIPQTIVLPTAVPDHMTPIETVRYQSPCAERTEK